MMITYSEKFSEADHGLAITQSIAAVVNHFAECAPFFPHVLICFLACSRAETERYIIMCINHNSSNNNNRMTATYLSIPSWNRPPVCKELINKTRYKVNR